ncbi:MAG: cupin domain-containing protein [Nitrospirales bacterium]
MNMPLPQYFNLSDMSTPKLFMMMVLATSLSTVLLAQPAWPDESSRSWIIDLSTIQWEPLKGVPEGAEIAMLWGNPKTGASEAMVKFSPGYVFPHHHHSVRERIIWMQGNFTYIADDGTRQMLGPMAYLNVAPGVKHSIRCESAEPCILYLTFHEPMDLHLHSQPQEKAHHP